MGEFGITSSRAGDFARAELLGNNYTSSSREMDKAEFQATTGRKGDSYKEIGSDTQSALTIGVAKSGAAQYKSNMEIVDQRLVFAEVSVNRVIDIVAEFRSQLAGIVDPGSSNPSFQRFCQDSLTEISQILNVQDIGRNNIFGGNEWSRPPVDLDALPVPILGGAVSTNYYQGSPDTLKADINEGQTLSYGLRADASGFAKALHSLKIGATFEPDFHEGSNSMQMLRNAMTTSAEATTDLAADLAYIGTSQKTMETVRHTIDSFVENITELEQSYIGVDVTEAWINFKRLENQLLSLMTASKIDTDLSKQLFTFLR